MNDRQRLEAIVAVVCKYLPPNGISREDAMREIISLVDPLPEQTKKQELFALKVVGDEICYLSKKDDQSFGMWCPVGYDHGFEDGTKFYTAPPRKEWVGLTDKEILDLWVANHKNTGATDAFACAVEAKLKEKNT